MKKGMSPPSSEHTEKMTGVKLPLLQLPKLSGNVLEWSAFYDAFIALVDSHKKLSNVQKFTHLRSCLSARVYKSIEEYSVANATTLKLCKIYKAVLDGNAFW